MSQQINLELLPREERIDLAIKALKSNANLSQRRAAAVYKVPESTLRRQRAKPASQRVIHPNACKLTKQEEEVLVQYIRKLDARGFAPTLAYVREMADQLLAARSGGKVGENWVYRFIQRKSGIKSQVSRPRDYRRVLCSDTAIISP